MAKLPAKVGLKAIPWLLVIEAASAARAHWGVLTPSERADLTRLLRTTKGRPSQLKPKEQAELRRLVGKLDLPGLGKDLLPIAAKRGRKH